MHFARLAGLLLVTIATLSQQQSVEITSEPSHHLVMENAYVRVFDVTVAPKASTLVHRHNNDYLFVTLGDSDVVSARPGEKPAALVLKDGEIRFTPGKFAHAAINQSDKPFHNITIELLKPATNVRISQRTMVQKVCVTSDSDQYTVCPELESEVKSDQWTMSLFTIAAKGHSWIQHQLHHGEALFIAVSDLDRREWSEGKWSVTRLTPGNLLWLPGPRGNDSSPLENNSATPARYAVLEFNAEKQ
jgi:hypothetical protein